VGHEPLGGGKLGMVGAGSHEGEPQLLRSHFGRAGKKPQGKADDEEKN